jgi:hypothetical protein
MAPQYARCGCGTVLYFQSKSDNCKNPANAGTSLTSVSSPPASSKRIFQFSISDKRAATTAPADPKIIIN